MNHHDEIIKQRLLDVLRFAIDLFKEHHITYYAAYGTAIGAVRHHGFIPWDDDIDLYVPRADYERLMTLTHSYSHPDYDLLTLHELEDLLQIAIDNEDYAKAAQIRDEINGRK